MRDKKPAAEHALQFLVSLKCVSGRLAAANTIRNVAEGDGAVTDGPDDLILGPKVLQRLRHFLIWIEVEGRAPSACYVNRVIAIEVHIFQLQSGIEFCDEILVREEAL